MRAFFFLIGLALVVFLIVCRDRIFLRDPIARVTRDGVAVEHMKVMINYPNDVLLDETGKSMHVLYLVQHWNKLAATPTAPLGCISFTACLMDADQASAVPIAPGSRGKRSPFEGVTMTNRRVEFVDEDGALVQVVLW